MMNKFIGAIGLTVLVTSAAFAAENAVVRPATQCNEAQLKQAKNAVDGIKDPQKQTAANDELTLAVQVLQQNDPQTCLMHLTKASKFVTP